MDVSEFAIRVPEDELGELRRRLASTRWPGEWPEPPWAAGSDAATVRRLVNAWSAFDWRASEARLNALPQHIATIRGQRVHFLRFRGGEGLPIVLTNGWPSTFAELIPVAQRLAAVGHDTIVPSLPGFTFSDPAATAPAAMPTHELWHQLMIGLGYTRFVAHGGDLGAGITSRLAAAHPEAVAGIHLMAVAGAADHKDLTAAEQVYLDAIEAWERDEGAYEHQQQTRPLTLAYGLSDSPAGLLAWIVEKYRAWSDCGGDLASRWSDDDILLHASLYWLTNSIGTSFRPYFDYLAHPLGPIERISVPTAVAVFPHDLVLPPKEYAERSYEVVRYTRFDRGGHFAPHEEPGLLADDILQFVAQI
ncbi:MAG TPA: epoxide hydrolase [Solirubrobacter sp.]